MHANNQASEDWMAATGAPWGAAFGYPAGGRWKEVDPAVAPDDVPEEQPGGDLLAFLSAFRTAQEEAETARLAARAAARRGPGSARRRASEEQDATADAASGNEKSRADDPYGSSDVQVAPDWWLATDGRWYRPELHPDAGAAGG